MSALMRKILESKLIVLVYSCIKLTFYLVTTSCEQGRSKLNLGLSPVSSTFSLRSVLQSWISWRSDTLTRDDSTSCNVDYISGLHTAAAYLVALILPTPYLPLALLPSYSLAPPFDSSHSY